MPLKIKYVLDEMAPEEHDPFVFGDMYLEDGNTSVTSANRSPNQSFMVLPSVTAMLDQFRVFLKNKRKTATTSFIGTSFAIDLSRVGRDISLRVGKVELNKVTEKDLVDELWRSSLRLAKDYRLDFAKPQSDHHDTGDAIDHDFITALGEFALAFNLKYPH